MQHSVTIIFPHQLFQHHPALNSERKIFLVEETLFFNQFNFHKQKLVLHRASMQFYCDWLKEKKYNVEYINSDEVIADVRKLVAYLSKQNYNEIHIAELADDWLHRRLHNACKKYNIRLEIYQTPGFITSIKEANEYYGDKHNYFQTDFYIWQRKRLKILLEINNQPLGGKWSFDYENRKRFPKNEIVPALHLPKENKYVKDARIYVENTFKNNYGINDEPFYNSDGFYPTTFSEAENWLERFYRNPF